MLVFNLFEHIRGTSVPKPVSQFRRVPQVKHTTLLMAVKMYHKKKLMVLGLVIVATLMVPAILAHAQTAAYNVEGPEVKSNKTQYALMKTFSMGNTNRIQVQNSAANMQKIRPAMKTVQLEEDLDIESVDEALIEKYVQEYEKLSDDQKSHGRSIWVVIAQGYSWKIEPTTDAVEARIPMAIRFGAKPVMDTGDGILFKVPRGTVGHDDERYEFEGYGWVRKIDGIFYMKLEGDDIRLKVIGKFYPRLSDASDCVRRLRFQPVVMKGKMSVEGERYLFALKGRAFRVCLHICEPVAMPEETVEPTTTS
jgi:hypothetical protein